MDFGKDFETAEQLYSNIEKLRFWNRKLFQAQKSLDSPFIADLRNRIIKYIYAVAKEIKYLEKEIDSSQVPDLFAYDVEENKYLIDLISDYIYGIPAGAILQKVNLGDGNHLTNSDEIKKRLLIKCSLSIANVLEGKISFKQAKTKIRSLIFRLTDDISSSYFNEHLSDTFDLLKNEILQKENGGFVNNNDKNFGYPDPLTIAESYYTETNSKNRPYSVDVITSVMKQTKKYLEKNPELKTIHGHIKSIIENCDHLEGGKDAKRNWIKHYANKVELN